MVDLERAMRNLVNQNNHWRVYKYINGQMVQVTQTYQISYKIVRENSDVSQLQANCGAENTSPR